MRVLVVEDNERLGELITGALRKAGYAVDLANDAGLCRRSLAAATYDLVLMDLSLPDEDGAVLLRDMRSRGERVPVVVITARGSLNERIEGLDRGADDYLVKPFNMDELLARCRAVLRRSGGRLGVVLSLGDVVLDTTSREVRVAQRMITLSAKEVSALTVLMRRGGQVVARDTIEQALTEFGRETTPNAVEAVISRLRRRLGGAHVAIEAVRGIGYIIKERDDVPARPVI